MPVNDTDTASRRRKGAKTINLAQADSIGTRLREARVARGMTLGQVSQQTGISIGSLSQVERGIVSPTIRTVYSIASVLEISPAGIIDPEGTQAAGAESPYISRASLHREVLNANGVIKLLSTPSGQDRYKGYRVTIKAGGSSGDESYAHNGEEMGFVLQGSFSLQIEGRTFLLNQGDCFAFPSSLRHRFFNNGEAEAVVFWVNSMS
jgi:transcriptional regulator with XRE-family HTH domain